MRRVAIDTGGTFTDCVLADEGAGTLTLAKVPSTPAMPAEAVGHGLDALLAAAGLEAADVDAVLHGTTVATNAVITGRWARTGMISTAGGRDVLEIGTQQRPKKRPVRARHLAPAGATARRQSALLRLSSAIAAATNEQEICESVVNGLRDEALGYNFLGVFLVNDASGDRVLVASVGWTAAKPGFRLTPGQGISERALLDGKPGRGAAGAVASIRNNAMPSRLRRSPESNRRRTKRSAQCVR